MSFLAERGVSEPGLSGEGGEHVLRRGLRDGRHGELSPGLSLQQVGPGEPLPQSVFAL